MTPEHLLIIWGIVESIIAIGILCLAVYDFNSVNWNKCWGYLVLWPFVIIGKAAMGAWELVTE